MDELYLVVELQKDGDTLSQIITEQTSLPQANYQFHYAAAFAAISSIDKHSVSILNENGLLVDRAIYNRTEEEEDSANQKYLVIELQVNNGQPAKIVTVHDTLQDAQYKFHSVAASASISSVQKHVVIIMNEYGFPIENAIFKH